MKLLIITNLFPNAAEPGRGIFNQQQLAALPADWRLEVVAPLPWAPRIPGVPQPAGWRTLAAVPARETIQGVTVHHPRYLVIPKVGRGIAGRTFCAAIRPLIRRLHRDAPFDAVLATWAYPDVYGVVRAVRGLGLPVVAKVHGSDVYLATRSLWRRRAVRWALSRCAGVIAVSSALKAQLIQFGVPENLIRVIPNGVDLKRFRPVELREARRELCLPLEGRRIVFVGNLAPVKGLETLLDAMTGLPEDITLSLVGDGELRAELAARIKHLGLTGRVTLVGRAPHAAVSSWMNAADVMCLSSVSEGCPNVVVEALACGTPVVGTRTGGIPELVRDGENGFLAAVGDTAGLAGALEQALAHSWSEERIRQSVIRRTWSATAADVADMLSRAVQGRAGAS